jgi:hypothetical protein
MLLALIGVVLMTIGGLIGLAGMVIWVALIAGDED